MVNMVEFKVFADENVQLRAASFIWEAIPTFRLLKYLRLDAPSPKTLFLDFAADALGVEGARVEPATGTGLAPLNASVAGMGAFDFPDIFFEEIQTGKTNAGGQTEVAPPMSAPGPPRGTLPLLETLELLGAVEIPPRDFFDLLPALCDALVRTCPKLIKLALPAPVGAIRDIPQTYCAQISTTAIATLARLSSLTELALPFFSPLATDWSPFRGHPTMRRLVLASAHPHEELGGVGLLGHIESNNLAFVELGYAQGEPFLGRLVEAQQLECARRLLDLYQVNNVIPFSYLHHIILHGISSSFRSLIEHPLVSSSMKLEHYDRVDFPIGVLFSLVGGRFPEPLLREGLELLFCSLANGKGLKNGFPAIKSQVLVALGGKAFAASPMRRQILLETIPDGLLTLEEQFWATCRSCRAGVVLRLYDRFLDKRPSDAEIRSLFFMATPVLENPARSAFLKYPSRIHAILSSLTLIAEPQCAVRFRSQIQLDDSLNL